MRTYSVYAQSQRERGRSLVSFVKALPFSLKIGLFIAFEFAVAVGLILIFTA